MNKPVAFLCTSILTLLTAWLSSACAVAEQPEESPLQDALPAAQASAIDGFVGQFTELGMFDGAVLVDIGGTVVYRKTFGYANYELGVRHTPQHRFRIASVSKAVTDTAMARLIEKGVLQLDTSIAEYLPDFPSADLITIRQLLEHTSGIAHTNRLEWGDGSISLSTAEIVDRLAQLPLDFPPGSDSRYSNGGYAGAARSLEVIEDAPLNHVLREELF